MVQVQAVQTQLVMSVALVEQEQRHQSLVQQLPMVVVVGVEQT